MTNTSLKSDFPEFTDRAARRKREIGYLVLAYAVTFLVCGLIFFFIRQVGLGFTAPPPPKGTVGAIQSSSFNVLPHLLLGLTVIIVASRLSGAIFTRFHQPPVIGEVIA